MAKRSFFMKRLIVLLAIIAAVWACKQKGTEPVSMSVSEDGNVTEQPSVKPEVKPEQPTFQDSLANDPSKGAEQFEGLSFSKGAETLSIVGETINDKRITCLVFADGNKVVLRKESHSPAYPGFSPFFYDTKDGVGSAIFAIDGTLTLGTNAGHDSDAYRLIK